MSLFTKLISSFSFWADVFFSVVGALIVVRGLKVGADAEKLLPPGDFRPDLYDDILGAQKSLMDHGHRLVMWGCVIEAVAAFIISVLSGLEVAEEKQARAEALVLAKTAELNAGKAMESAAFFEKSAEELRATNLAIQAKLNTVAAWRTISDKQKTNLCPVLKELQAEHTNQLRLAIWSQDGDAESRAYGKNIISTFKECGIPGFFVIYSSLQHQIFYPGLRFAVCDTNKIPLADFEVLKAFLDAGIATPYFIGDLHKPFGIGDSNVIIIIGSKPPVLE